MATTTERPKAQPKRIYLDGQSCSRCESPAFNAIPVQDGRGTRLDCARCGLAHGFSKWNGHDLEIPKPAGIARSTED